MREKPSSSKSVKLHVTPELDGEEVIVAAHVEADLRIEGHPLEGVLHKGLVACVDLETGPVGVGEDGSYHKREYIDEGDEA